MSTDSAQTPPSTAVHTTGDSPAASDAAVASAAPDHQRLRGIFSSQEIRKVGTGTTQRKTIQKTYWFADELPSGEIQLQLLNSNYIPSGPKKTISIESFLDKYKPEPEFYVQTVFPRISELNKTIARAERYRTNGETYSAEYEFNNALKVDVENVRANFGLGLTYLERGSKDKAEDIFQRLVRLDAAFNQEHKHLFNEFGINLRKNKMINQSIEYYKRALELEKRDENLYLNLARAFLEKKDYPETIRNVIEALTLNPSSETGRKFLEWLLKNKLLNDQQIGQARNILVRTEQAPQPAPVPASPAGTLQPEPPGNG